MIAGSADMAEGALAPAVDLAQAGGGAKLIVVDQKTSDHLFVSQSTVGTLADLVGKRVGITTPGDTSDTLSRLVLRRENVDEDGVNWVEIGGTSARMAGLLADKIDAGLAHAAEGINALAVSEGKLKVLWRVGDTVPLFLQRGLMASDQFLAENPNLAQLVVDTLINAVRWSADSQNEDAYVALACPLVELPDDVCHEAWTLYREVGMWAVNGGLDADLLRETIAIEVEVGNLNEPIPDSAEWLDASLVDSYLARFGTQTE
jgi:NitT/TauT family transport system substrate-binding protein